MTYKSGQLNLTCMLLYFRFILNYLQNEPSHSREWGAVLSFKRSTRRICVSCSLALSCECVYGGGDELHAFTVVMFSFTRDRAKQCTGAI